jgi:hypothetical protein
MNARKINLQTTLESLPKIHSLLPKYTDRLKPIRQFQYYYIVDYILRHSEKNNNSVSINRSNLASVLGVNNKLCSEMLKDLYNLEIIDVVKFHNHQVNSTHYAIPEKFDNLVSFTLVEKEFKCLSNIIKKRNKAFEGYSNTTTGKLYLDYINSIRINNIEYIECDLYNRYVVIPNGVKSLKMKVFKRALTNVQRIEKGDYWVKRPDLKSRVYCNLSILHRAYRKFLTYKGETLKCVDITNSQPTLAGVLIKDVILKDKRELPKDLELYIQDCEQGIFYENFMNEEQAKPENRTEFKKTFFGAVFFSKVSKRNNKLKTLFKNRYPNVYEEICEIKGGLGSTTYNQFAISLQRLEASIIFEGVNLPMLKEGYKCYNIYDSIVSHDVETLYEATKRIKQEFAKYGVNPTIKIEDFTKY